MKLPPPSTDRMIGLDAEIPESLQGRVHGSNVLVLRKDLNYAREERGRQKRFSALFLRTALTSYAASSDYVPWVRPPEGATVVAAGLRLVEDRIIPEENPVDVLPSGRIRIQPGMVEVNQVEDPVREIGDWVRKSSGGDSGIKPLVGEETLMFDMAKRLGDADDSAVKAVGLLIHHTLEGSPFPLPDQSG